MKNNVPEKVAQDVFGEMAGFASYAFNKSHAAAYSVVAYRTAYLKCHFYKEYMAALMSAFTEYTGKLMEYISECGRHGVKILRPDINESDMGFTAAEDGIRFSLLAAKNLGRGMISEIIEEREKNGRYVSLTDLVKRMNGHDFSRRCAESLIKCGALDGFALNRRQMLENYDLIANACADYSRGAIEGQLDFSECPTAEALRRISKAPSPKVMSSVPPSCWKWKRRYWAFTFRGTLLKICAHWLRQCACQISHRR